MVKLDALMIIIYENIFKVNFCGKNKNIKEFQ